MSAYNYTLHFTGELRGKGENYFSFKATGHNDEHWYFETSCHIDDTVKRVFSDMINNTHFDHPDIERFLTTKGTIVSECITAEIGSKFVIPKPEVFKNSKIVIVCMYYNDNATSLRYVSEIYDSIRDSIGIIEGYLGLIDDDTMVPGNVIINIIAMCNAG